MKITRIETFIVEADVASWVFLQPGHGRRPDRARRLHPGEQRAHRAGRPTDITPVAGAGPQRIERLWQELYRRSPWQGRPVHRHDPDRARDVGHHRQGLRAAGVPAPGGRVPREPAPVHPGPSRPATAAGRRRGPEAVWQGYTALKTDSLRRPVLHRYPAGTSTTVGPRRAHARGGGAGTSPSPSTATSALPPDGRAIARERAPLGVLFFEEPVPSDNPDALARVAPGDARLRVPWPNGGAPLHARWAFRPLLERRLVDVIQPDVCTTSADCGKGSKIARHGRAVRRPDRPTTPTVPSGWRRPGRVLHAQLPGPRSTHSGPGNEAGRPALQDRGRLRAPPTRTGPGVRAGGERRAAPGGDARPMDFWRQVVVE